MFYDLMEYWLSTGKYAIIQNILFKPIQHIRGKPLSSQKGQATVYFLVAENGQWWLLKIFHKNQSLDKNYLNRISALLPPNEGFMCGTKRKILSKGALLNKAGTFYSNEFNSLLDGTILMPITPGCDWASITDDIRDGSIKLDIGQRLIMCIKLTELIRLLEYWQCCHRDLSCGNVFIDLHDMEVYLIDFDSFYHPSLFMPKTTTCGTSGYISHLVFAGDKPIASKTWCPYADRFALAILNAEFLILEPHIKATGDGGIFDQQELNKQSGKTLDSILKILSAKYPKAAQMLDAAIKCKSFADCPSPKDWIDFYRTIPGFIIKPPKLEDMPEITGMDFRKILDKCKPLTPIWPAPKLCNLPDIKPQILPIYQAPLLIS